ncbi:MAG: hypothetical protein R3Y43_06400 [Alphaproteobacteria bacterium]
MIDTSLYDFVINDEDEVMLLLYVKEGEPLNSTIQINFTEASAILNKNEDTTITLEDIPADILDSLSETDKLMVCEMSVEEDETKTEIIYAYEAEILD